MLSDQELWSGLKNGDAEMYFLLYRKYYNVLFFIGLKEINDKFLIKDVIHEQFLYLWEKKETVQQAANVRAYLISSFKRRLRENWKLTNRNCNLEIAWISELKECSFSPEELLINKDSNLHLQQQISSYLQLLPARQRELIELKFYEGLTYDQIAKKTNLSQRTVYNSIYEALKKLREILTQSKESSSRKIASVFLFFLIALLIAF